MTPHLRQLHAPEPLHGLARWLMWRYQDVPGSDKPGKIPYWVNGTVRHGRQGDPIDREHLVDFATAKQAAAASGFDGVGFAPLPGDDLVFVDVDNCVRAGKIDDTVYGLIDGTYAEFSPSHKGVRAVFRGNLGNRKSAGKRADEFGFEVFSSSGFVTMTGSMTDTVDLLGLHNTIAPVPEHLRDYCDKRFGGNAPTQDPDDFMAGYEPRLQLSVGQMETMLSHLDPDMDRQHWINVGMALHHECEGDDTGFDIWNDWSANGGKYVSEEDLRVQWDSFTRRAGPGRRQVTMRSVIWMAKEAGYQHVKPVADSASLSDVADAIPVGDLPGSTPHDFTGKFHIQHVEAAVDRPLTRWFIKGALPVGDLGIIFGSSGSGKSFVAFDVAAALARGVPWRGRKTIRSRVLYIAAEGSGGVPGRIKAYCRQHDVSMREMDLSIMYAAPNFMDAEDISEVCNAIKAAGGFDILIVDTFAQVTPGANENASEDMGRALANAQALCRATNAMVILIHHAGKDASRGSRGWSGLKGAADFQWEIVRHESGEREIHLEKVKDGEDGLHWGFKLDRVTLCLDEDGDEVTSCVVLETEISAKAVAEGGKGVKRRGKYARHVLEYLETLPDDKVSMPVNTLVADAAALLPVSDGMRDVRRQNILREIRELAKEKNGPFFIDNNLVIFCV